MQMFYWISNGNWMGQCVHISWSCDNYLLIRFARKLLILSTLVYTFLTKNLSCISKQFVKALFHGSQDGHNEISVDFFL